MARASGQAGQRVVGRDDAGGTRDTGETREQKTAWGRGDGVASKAKKHATGPVTCERRVTATDWGCCMRQAAPEGPILATRRCGPSVSAGERSPGMAGTHPKARLSHTTSRFRGRTRPSAVAKSSHRSLHAFAATAAARFRDVRCEPSTAAKGRGRHRHRSAPNRPARPTPCKLARAYPSTPSTPASRPDAAA